MIPYGRQEILQDDIDAVVSGLKSDFLPQGPMVPLFEKSVENFCGVKHAVAVNSATSALHIACLALGVGPGDMIWTSPISFVASSNCALYCGANIDFVDINSETYNIDIEALKQKLITASNLGTLPKVLIPVHLCGEPCDMQAIYALSQQYGFKVIEDASHAIGASYLDGNVGNCQFSDITVFSFHPVKIITTGEGGMATTNQDDLRQSMELLRSHGITRNESLMSKESDGPWYYEQIQLGFNYRMTELQAALGLSQMNHLNNFVNYRHEIASFYSKEFASSPLLMQKQSTEARSAFHLYVVRIDLTSVALSHKQIFSKLRQAGIGVNLHYIPIYKQPFYQKMGFDANYCPEAEKYYQEALSLPIFPLLKQVDQQFVVHTLKKILYK